MYIDLESLWWRQNGQGRGRKCVCKNRYHLIRLKTNSDLN